MEKGNIQSYRRRTQIPSGSTISKIIFLHVSEIKRVVRIAFDYTIDIIIGAVRPASRMISIHPLEVHYAKRGHFEDHPIKNFIKTWDKPNLSATSFAATILVEICGDDDAINWTADLALDSLAKLYQPETGGFRSSVGAKEADFQSTYYAIKTVQAISKLNIDSMYIASRTKVDFEKVCKYLKDAASSVEAITDRKRRVDINFSIFEKCYGSSMYLSKSFDSCRSEKWDHGYVIEQIKKHAVISDGKIRGFKLHKTDAQISLTAIKSGISMFEQYGTSYGVDMPEIIKFVSSEMERCDTTHFHSQLFNLYNAHHIMKKLKNICAECKAKCASNICSDCDSAVYSMNLFSKKLDNSAINLEQSLRYKGGYMFNTASFSAPNLYATRLLIEILSDRGITEVINKAKLKRFVEHCFDMQSSLYRCYPYRSWYYKRNV